MSDTTRPPIFDPNGTSTLEVLAGARKFNEWTYETISPFLRGNVLEIGSGIANISSFAIDAGKTITLSDINPEYRDYLNKKYQSVPNVGAILSIDLLHPDFETAYAALGNSFDSVFLLNVIEHISDDRRAIMNCRFMLKKGGYLIVLAPSYQFLYCLLDKNLGHFRRYSLRSLRAIVPAKEFGIVKQQYFNLAGIAGWLLFGKILGRPALGKSQLTVYNRLVPLFRVVDRITFRMAGLSSIIIAKRN